MTNIQDIFSLYDSDNITKVVDDYINHLPQCEEEELDFFNIYSMNIRSLSKNFDEFIYILENYRTKYDILILTETWCNVNIPFMYSIPGYRVVDKNAYMNKCDGLCMYIKDSLSFDVVDCNLRGCNSICIDVVTPSGKSLKIIGVYRSPNGDVSNFLESVDEYISSIPNNVDVCFVGDINLNLCSNNKITNEYLDLMNGKGYKPYITSYTRVTEKSETCLDHIFLKISDKMIKYKSGNILKTNITDHFSVSLNLGYKGNINKNISHKITYKKIDYNKLKDLLSQDNLFSDLKEINSEVNQMVSTFVNTLNRFIEISSREITIPHKKKPLKPWMVPGLINAINKKDKMYKKLKKEPFNNKLREDLRVYKNTLNKLIISTKNNYYTNEINRNSKNPRNLWKCINDIIDETNNKNADIKIEASELNSYFAEVGKKHAEAIPKSGYLDNLQFKNYDTLQNSWYLTPVEASDVEKIIHKLKNNASPGTDNISNYTLKQIAQYIAEPLADIINKIFVTGTFPNHFKIAKLKPIFKGGDKTKPSNYRPISLLSNLAKIAEKLIKVRLINFLDKNNIIEEQQFGFQRNKSTEDALCSFVNQISNNLNKRNKTMSIFLDLSKAFDTIPHETLFKKLHKIGIRGITLDLFKSYLQERSQILTLNSQKSNLNLTAYGLPQGTVLSPVLFLIYVNDLLKLKLKNGKIVSFADDTAIIFSSANWLNLFNDAESDIITIKKWLDLNTMSLNVNKTKYITFSPNSTGTPENHFKLRLHSHCSNQLICNCPEIEKVNNTKYLGVIIDENLKWQQHISFLCKKLKYISYKFYKLNKILNINNLKTVYHALVQSVLQYGLVIWGAAYDVHIENLFIIQKNIIKTILNRSRLYPTNLIFQDFNVFTVRQLYIGVLLKYIVKNKSKFPKLNKNIYNFRPNVTEQFQIYITRLSLIRRQLIYTSSKLINTIPFDLDRKISKKSIKEWIKREYFHTLNIAI